MSATGRRPGAATLGDVIDPHALDPLSLVGRWDFSRTIDDRLTGTQSTVVGHTDLVAESAERVRWHEEGILYTDDRELEVFRNLYVVLQDGSWNVTFEDGRYFHPWVPGENVEHPCGADMYVGRISAVESGSDARAVARWTVQWKVSGPRKDYTMTTVLTAPGAADRDLGRAHR